MTRSNNDISLALWFQKNINHDSILSIDHLDSNLLLLNCICDRRYTVTVVKCDYYDKNELVKLGDLNNPDFVCNFEKDAYICGDVLKRLEDEKVGIGDVSDLYRALRDRNVSEYMSPEVENVLRILRQHKKVDSLDRLDSRRYKVNRLSLPPLVVLAINEYEITADVIRNKIEVYPEFDVIFKTNPNSREIQSCIELAESMGLKICNSKELYKELHK